MHVTTITVHVARGFNHPTESFANFKLGVTLQAALDHYEDENRAVRELHDTARKMVDEQRDGVLKECRREQLMDSLSMARRERDRRRDLLGESPSDEAAYHQERLERSEARVAKLEQELGVAPAPIQPAPARDEDLIPF